MGEDDDASTAVRAIIKIVMMAVMTTIQAVVQIEMAASTTIRVLMEINRDGGVVR